MERALKIVAGVINTLLYTVIAAPVIIPSGAQLKGKRVGISLIGVTNRTVRHPYRGKRTRPRSGSGRLP